MCGGAEISPVGSLLQGWAFKKQCGGVCGCMGSIEG